MAELKDLTESELKVLAYDTIVQINKLQQQLQNINSFLYKEKVND